MKIIKTKRLVEAVEEEVLDSVSADEIAADIQDGAEEADIEKISAVFSFSGVSGVFASFFIIPYTTFITIK